MKFLVIGKAIEYGGPFNPSDFAMISENVILPSLEIVKDWDDKKKVVGGLFAGQRAGVFIVEASSAEELSSLLQSLPFWGQNNWKVIPLQTFQSGIEDLKRQIVNVKKMAKMVESSQMSKMPK